MSQRNLILRPSLSVPSDVQHKTDVLSSARRIILTLVNAGLVDITHGGGLDDVADDKLLDGLVLGAAAGAVGAPDRVHVAAAVLIASSIAAFGRLPNETHGRYKLCLFIGVLGRVSYAGHFAPIGCNELL